MRARRLPVLLAAVAAIAAGCSSAPPPSNGVSTVKDQAAQDSAVGEGYYRQARYDLAIQFFLRALNGYTSVDDGEGVTRTYNLIGKTYLATSSLDQAEDMFVRARQRAKGVSDSLLFDSSNNLGELYLARGDAARARDVLLEALALPAGAQTPARTAIVYHNLGTAEKNLGEPAQALEYYGKSLQINLAQKLQAEAASDYYMIASVHSREGRFDEAVKNAELALAVDKRIENSPGIAEDLYALGLISTRRADSAAAFDYFQRSYMVYTTIGLKSGMRKALTHLVSTCDALGRTADGDTYRKALADLGTQ